MPQWINYKQLKAEIAFTDVLEHYRVDVRMKGEQAKAKCPLPSHDADSNNKRSLSINLDRNIFQCFSCGAKGNVLDFIALMESLNPADRKDFHKAAEVAKRKFLYTPHRETPTTIRFGYFFGVSTLGRFASFACRLSSARLCLCSCFDWLVR